tara:strand:- start:4159 stop:5337 length:1179 start_codon:yes stop_codon:yes gene_type:complete
VFLTALFFYGCVEEIDFETETFESALVVEATITDINEQQNIKLSRTFQFEEDGPTPESNAQVSIIDETGGKYNFVESEESGTYVSTTAFAAVANHSYQLKITTANGRNYESTPVHLPQGVQIDNLSAERGTSTNGSGVSILLDSYNPEGTSNYYRFEYEETYKIVSPYDSNKDLILVNDTPPYTFDIVPKTREEKVCYNTKPSTEIIIANTNSLTEDRLSSFEVKFIDRENPIISKRYSILVKEYVLSFESYTFYETLKSFSGSESLFSQVQPGFIPGNITSVTNEDEKVIGIFEATPVSSKRIFFNYIDFFNSDDGEPGSFAEDCMISRPDVIPDGRPLGTLIKIGSVKFLGVATGPGDFTTGFGPYNVVPTPCMDCNVFGTNVAPDFWEE